MQRVLTIVCIASLYAGVTCAQPIPTTPGSPTENDDAKVSITIGELKKFITSQCTIVKEQDYSNQVIAKINAQLPHPPPPAPPVTMPVTAPPAPPAASPEPTSSAPDTAAQSK